MLASIAWLKKYVEIPVDTETLVEDLTMTGLNVERRIQRGYTDPMVVVGRVLEVQGHPNADKLVLCRVEVGEDGPKDIVCGAPNVADGQLVLVALPGSKLPDGTKIRSAKIRGVRSEGMICSERELGLGDDAGGIMVLDGDFSPGAAISEVLGAPDEILEIEVTPNRPDLLCHIGIAREIAAIYEVDLHIPKTSESDDKRAPDFEVKISDSSDCARYVGKRVSGVRVGPSPQWLVAALESVGLHSVNNIVDVANYVMMEMGQPIHAFDFKTLRGSKIVVRRAEESEKMLALDGNTYETDKDVLSIADAKEGVALAGIIGGEETAVHDDTTEILIESANFDASLIRSARKKLGIPTDASYRFERGVDREMCRAAAERTADLVYEVAGGESGALVDVYPAPRKPVDLSIRRSATQRLLGVSLTTDEIGLLLERLGFERTSFDQESVSVSVPPNRLDIVEETDLIEEVARLYGYNRIGKGWNYRCSTYGVSDPFDELTENLVSHMVSRGFSEVVTSSFTDGQELADFGWQADDPRSKPIPILNPLNANHEYLKTSLIPGMLDAVRRNIDHGTKKIRMCQMGKIFLSLEGHSQLPEERHMLGIVLSRPDDIDFWNDSKQSMDLLDIKKEVEVLLQAFRIDLGSDIVYNFDTTSGDFAYSFKNKLVIEGGIVSEAISTRYGFEQPVWWATVDVDEIYRRHGGQPKFRALAEYPSSRRDLSLVAGHGIQFGEIEKSLVKSAGPLLESLQVFDVYTGDNVGSGLTAYGVRLNFRSSERTLTDPDVDKAIEKIVSNLKKQLGVELRT